MSKFGQIMGSVKSFAIKHSPEILTGIGITGMITAGILAVKATPKALILIRERKEELYPLDEEDDISLTPIETVKTCWKCYIPAAVTCTVSVGCLIGASSVNFRRNAALATAYTISETALKEYQEKVVETIGEKKEKDIKDKIAKDKIDKDPVSNKEVIITDKGDVLCYDTLSGRYFKSSMDQLKKAENDLSRQMRDDMYVSLNEFYNEIGLDGIGVGYELGWNIDDGYIELEFSSQISDDGRPCIVVGHYNPPKYDFKKLF